MAFEAITGAVGALKGASTVLEYLRNVDKSIGDAEWKLKVADLATHLAEARLKLADVQEYMLDLEKALATREDLRFDRSTNVYRDDEGAPFCPKCFDGDGKACRMDDRVELKGWVCLTCGRSVLKPGFPRPRKARTARRAFEP